MTMMMMVVVANDDDDNDPINHHLHDYHFFLSLDKLWIFNENQSWIDSQCYFFDGVCKWFFFLGDPLPGKWNFYFWSRLARNCFFCCEKMNRFFQERKNTLHVANISKIVVDNLLLLLLNQITTTTTNLIAI